MELKGLTEFVNGSIIEMESTIGDLNDNSIYLGEFLSYFRPNRLRNGLLANPSLFLRFYIS